jgi:uncharacterized protein (UPF0332 family)
MPEDGDGPDPGIVEDQLRQARQALDDATGAHDAGLSDAVVVNRLYYACFHAAQATLYDRGHHPESHGGVLSLFGSEVVLDGDATRNQGRLLNRLSNLRKRADYESGPIQIDLDELLSEAREFVAAMERVVTE